MDYIQSVSPLSDFRLEVKMTNGSSAIVDFKLRFHAAKYMPLKDEEIFRAVSTDGNYVLWKNGLVKITAKEVLEVILAGDYVTQGTNLGFTREEALNGEGSPYVMNRADLKRNPTI